MATAVPAPHDAVAPTEPPAVAVRNVYELAADYGILFGGLMPQLVLAPLGLPGAGSLVSVAGAVIAKVIAPVQIGGYSSEGGSAV